MNGLLKNRLLLQLVFTSAAALSVMALSVLLVRQAVRNAQSALVSEAQQATATAASELLSQYGEISGLDSSWTGLPEAAQDVSLQSISRVVLRSYPGMQGGFATMDRLRGVAAAARDNESGKSSPGSQEAGMALGTARRALVTREPASSVVQNGSDLIVVSSMGDPKRGIAAWSLKRLPGANNPGAHQRELLLSALVIAALLGIAGSLATGLSLRRGVLEVQRGLTELERDFDYRLRLRADELGEIGKSINRMASVRRELEEKLRREDRLRATGRLAAALAHEIRNPLNSIRLTIQLLEQRRKTNSIRAEDLELVKDEVDRLNSLLTDLLDLQRVRKPQPEQQAIRPVIERTLELIGRHAEARLRRIEFDPGDWELTACFDGKQLTQTVMNLLLNALEATGEGGSISVRIGQADGVATVAVSDSGPGLGAEQIDHLFEPFYTTKTDGTGLGLAVSRELMRSQGGDLVFQPEVNGGTFVVQLPMPAAGPKPEKPAGVEKFN
jgi:signal transduction histidine kinase